MFRAFDMGKAGEQSAELHSIGLPPPSIELIVVSGVPMDILLAKSTAIESEANRFVVLMLSKRSTSYSSHVESLGRLRADGGTALPGVLSSNVGLRSAMLLSIYLTGVFRRRCIHPNW